MEQFDADHENSPLFKFTRGYMAMVMEKTFIRAVRTGDWDLHLDALQLLVKYFFAHDMLNYARMIPVYLAEMEIDAAVEGRVSLAQVYAAAATTRQEKSVTMST